MRRRGERGTSVNTLAENIAASESDAMKLTQSSNWDYAFRILADDVLHRQAWGNYPMDRDVSRDDIIAMLRDVEKTALRLRMKMERT